MTRIALALGGGGAKGLAHIEMLAAFDELGITPHRMSGASIGGAFAAAYASGTNAADIRAYVDRLVVSRGDRLADVFAKKDLWKWLDMVDFRRRGAVKVDNFAMLVDDGIIAPAFEDLRIPLRLVASDYWNREKVVLDTGDLATAVKASMAIPGVFAPVEIGDKLLIDGGAVDPVPYDAWLGECDVTVAIDVSGARTAGRGRRPGFFDLVFNSFQIMQRAILDEKMKRVPPDILIRPDIRDVRVFEFFKAPDIAAQSAPEKERLKRELDRVIGGARDARG
jgi:NTE family protein